MGSGKFWSQMLTSHAGVQNILVQRILTFLAGLALSLGDSSGGDQIKYLKVGSTSDIDDI